MKKLCPRIYRLVFLVVLFPRVNSQLDFFDQAAFLDSSSGPVMLYCLNEANLELGIDLIAVEIPSQFMLSRVAQEFP